MSRLALFCAAMAAACFLSCFLSGTIPILLGALLLGALLFLRIFVKSRRGLRWMAAGLCFGFLWFSAYTALVVTPASALSGRTIQLEAVVTDFPTIGTYGVLVPVQGGEAGGRAASMTLSLPAEYAALRPGDALFCVAHCQTNTGRVDQAGTLFAQAYGEITLHPAQRIPLRFAPTYLGEQVRGIIAKLYPPEDAAFFQALITGDKTELDSSTKNTLSRAGLSHVIAVSGMHISFLAGFLLLFCKQKKSGAALQIALIFLFAAMTGNGPGALRAAILCSAALLAPFLRRRPEPVTGLLAALALLLLISPYAIMDIGLQLSFAATLGIHLLGRPVYHRWMHSLSRGRKKILSPILSLLAVSIGANLFTLPLCALYFGQVSLIAPLTNLITNWSICLCFLLGIVSVILGALFPPLGMAVAVAARLPLSFFLWVAQAAAGLPFAALTLDSVYYRAFFAFLYVLLLLYIYWWQRGQRRLLIPVCSLCCALCLCLLLTNWSLRQTSLQLAVLDVGQGQSIALTSGDRRALIDCGGSKSAGDIAASYFAGLGHHTLDLLVLTHYHSDHANGVPELFSRMQIAAIALPDTDHENSLRLEIERLALESGTQIWYIDTQSTLSLGAAQLTIYPPVNPEGQNEAGLSILCVMDDWEALITGDMDTRSEAQLLARYLMPDIELLVAGHHGSRYSSGETLLETVTPDLVAISVGAQNTYGHPAPDTLTRLEEYDLPIWRTDTMGTILISLYHRVH